MNVWNAPDSPIANKSIIKAIIFYNLLAFQHILSSQTAHGYGHRASVNCIILFITYLSMFSYNCNWQDSVKFGKQQLI